VTQPVNDSELQCYDSRHVSVFGGSLHLELAPQPETCGGKSRSYASGLISSNPDALGAGKGFQFTYGLVEFRAYVPGAAGGGCANWPALWTDGQNWPVDGEIDVYECLSRSASWHLHSDTSGGAGDGPGGWPSGTYTGWHTFAADWEPGSVTFYYDGTNVGSRGYSVTSPNYLILNNAVDSSDAITAPTDVRVDYVRVWRK
jgi:beta-glucanase (GH16 family)